MSLDTEKLLWVYIEYNYSPKFFHKELLTRLKKAHYEHFKLKPIDKLDVPFSIGQVTKFLEACASVMFFCLKNGIEKPASFDTVNTSRKRVIQHSVEMITNIYIKELEGFNCLRSYLKFSPRLGDKRDISYDTELRIIGDESDDDIQIKASGRVNTFECIVEPYSKEEVEALKYYPKSVGYDIMHEELRLERFKISKELKEKDYPLYLNDPYIKEFVEYQFSLTKDKRS